MNQTEKYSDRELMDMKERCLYMITSFQTGKDCYNSGWSDIYQIALIEINRKLDERKNMQGAAKVYDKASVRDLPCNPGRGK